MQSKKLRQTNRMRQNCPMHRHARQNLSGHRQPENNSASTRRDARHVKKRQKNWEHLERKNPRRTRQSATSWSQGKLGGKDPSTEFSTWSGIFICEREGNYSRWFPLPRKIPTLFLYCVRPAKRALAWNGFCSPSWRPNAEQQNLKSPLDTVICWQTHLSGFSKWS